MSGNQLFRGGRSDYHSPEGRNIGILNCCGNSRESKIQASEVSLDQMKRKAGRGVISVAHQVQSLLRSLYMHHLGVMDAVGMPTMHHACFLSILVRTNDIRPTV